MPMPPLAHLSLPTLGLKAQGLSLNAPCLLPSYTSHFNSLGSFQPLTDTQLSLWRCILSYECFRESVSREHLPCPHASSSEPQGSQIDRGRTLLRSLNPNPAPMLQVPSPTPGFRISWHHLLQSPFATDVETEAQREEWLAQSHLATSIGSLIVFYSQVAPKFQSQSRPAV